VRVALSSDHAGWRLKQEVKTCLEQSGVTCIDLGTDSETESVDYPDFAAGAARAVARGECDRGICICGTGIGMSIGANKIKGIRAALCHDVYSARMTRLHNDSNVLALGARVIGPGLALEIVRTWLETPFEGGRHARRVAKLSRLEEGAAE